ncbi:transglycosylase family protein [Streptomyces sp. NPDC051907]|uniref:transglycosylase family protein n=1 Tax=Streptomyces sp. NPDC051907 TaxID=3155284 RepID=UPI003426BB08
MRSGNGRHRRPRQAPALVVAAGVTGSAIAIPLLGATSASAADGTTWDRVAECESSGMWSADLGNGYYGGLQLSQETWETYGGTAYAPRADLASRTEQIAVAEMVLAAQGPDAWPGCSSIAGLKIAGSADGVTAQPTPRPSAPIDQPSGEPTGEAAETTSDKPEKESSSDEPAAPSKPEQSAQPSAPARSEESAEPSKGATPESGSGAGKHRGEPAPEGTESGNTDNERESGRHASRGDGSTREPANADTSPGEYTVRTGDSLWTIADEQEVPGGWTALYEANRKAVGEDPDLILPGQSLDLDHSSDPK